ncbi:hypothetical protein ACERK3_17325 [Phycisphaerales bacterium AB-hyl4]|uniref:Transposase n=1 Tax=Natronomicrosphaera hydrolytica TaxID=3242702 RepID=A0ABV4UB45_9BACT
MLCDAHGHPLHFHLTAGQTHKAATLGTLLVGADEALLDQQDQRTSWPVAVSGDKGTARIIPPRLKFPYTQRAMHNVERRVNDTKHATMLMMCRNSLTCRTVKQYRPTYNGCFSKHV